MEKEPFGQGQGKAEKQGKRSVDKIRR